MGCLKLSYYEQGRAFEVNPIFFTSAVEKKRYAEKNRLSSSTYGFNGMEKDDEVSGSGNSYDYGMRMYDPRIGRPFSIDPIAHEFPELSPYQFFSNSPIQNIDLDGLEGTKPPKKGTVSFIVVVNEKEITFSFKEKSPHKFTLSDGTKKEKFNLMTKERIKGGNKNSLALFKLASTEISKRNVDTQQLLNQEFQGTKVIDIINTALDEDKLEIDVVGNVAVGTRVEDGELKFNFSDFDNADFPGMTTKRAENVKQGIFNGSDNVKALSVVDVIKPDFSGVKEGFEGVAKPNQDFTGAQIFLRKPKEKKSAPSF